MIQPSNELVMRITLYIAIIFFASQALHGCERVPSKGEMNKLNAKLYIDGKNVNAINFVFDDFKRDKENEYHFSFSDSLREIKYYAFTLEEDDDLIYVEIGFNDALLGKDLNLTIRGGNMRYELDKNSFSIINKIRYK